ncbi:hypothetical protein HUT06_41850 [Actinomadura sp. NAK00032]|uniref:hypothetical protein n=1 Tax=Actinomadura sp. NAK00032 TaxID=2742128 RepID=UPI001591BFFD|nr:hypothetical protein [Actinomadura sp. NAK00032]QKW39772.1 hypothetical protein HUT06_41850 [Actinomadura sp. NAK00032]
MKRALVVTAIAAPLLVSGVGLAVGAGLQASSGGAFATPERRFSSSAVALKTDEIEVGAETARAGDPMPDLGELAEVEIVVRGADPRVPLFVGIGPKEQVEGYLRGVAYEEFVSADLDPFRPVFRKVQGVPRAADSPLRQPFWVASSAGSGTRTVTWDKTGGAWSVVVMRMDGRPGVDVRATIGLRFGFALPAAIVCLAAGTVPLVWAVVARRRGVRRAQRADLG